jgi:hypothetical protein
VSTPLSEARDDDRADKPPISVGRRNPHCSRCGDERGGDFGHEISECQYRREMTVSELAETMPPDKKSRYHEAMIDAYFEREFGARAATDHD